MLIINDYFHNPFHRSGFMANLGKKVLVYSLCSMLASPFMVLPRQAYANTQNYTVFSGGTIYTMTESLKEVQNNVKPHKAKAVVVDNKTGKIIKVFKENENADMYTKNANYKQINLGTNVMLPGFIDPHGHFPSALVVQTIDVSPTPIITPGVDSVADLRKKLIETTKQRDPKGTFKWVQGFGYDDTMYEPQGHPTHEELMKDGLDKYKVTVTHISGHMSVVNTNSLKLLFDSSYYTSLKQILVKSNILTDGSANITKAELIKDSNGNIQYQLTLDKQVGTSNKLILPGIQMRTADAAFGTGIDDSQPDKAVQYMTGLLLETAMSYIAVPGTAYQALEAYYPTADPIAYASKDYIARGVTSANHGGSTSIDSVITQAQNALLEGTLPIRMVIQPRIYLNSGTDITEDTLRQHYALGWKNMIVTGPSAQRTIGTPHPEAQTGKDITTWFPGTLNPSADKADSTHVGAPGDDQKAAGSAANKLFQQKENVKDRLLLGTWKYNYDGSIQGYTGYLAEHGYYKLPEGDVTFNPGGRTGDEKAGTGAYVLGGTISVNDPKYFCGADAHYGNENSLGTGTYTSMEKAVNDYHKAGQGVSFHLNGSWANDDVVNFIEQAAAHNPTITDTRHTIIHAQMQNLQHIQRIMGNYNQFPIDTPNNIKKFTSVWTGVNALEWTSAAQQLPALPNGYNPEEGQYGNKFATDKPYTGENLRKLLGTNPETNLMRAQNIISSYFVDHTYYWGERHRDIFMGPGRAYNMSPMGWAVALGHRYTFHNDTPVTPQNPLKSISIATTRLSSGQIPGGKTHAPEKIYGTAGEKNIKAVKKYPETLKDKEMGKLKDFHDFDQRITVLQALHAVTVNSAFSSKIEDRFGSIKPDYWADFVVLAQDPFELEKEGKTGLLKIADIPVVATIVANKPVFGFLPGTKAGEFVRDLEKSYHNPGNPFDGSAVNVTDIATKELNPADVEAMMHAGGEYYGAINFTANVDSGKIAVFSIQIMGNGDPISTLNVRHFINDTPTGIIPYQFLANADATQDGKFWVTTKAVETPLAENTIMEPGQAYYVHFTVQDDGSYDLDNNAGKIEGQIFVTANKLPVAPTTPYAGHGGGGGCTIGTTAQYDLALVILAALGLLAIRIYRKRDNA